MDEQKGRAREWNAEAYQRVLEHTVGFYAEVGQEVGEPYLRTVGTGALIEYEGWRAMLTARHVISELISKENRIHDLTHKNVLKRHAERMQSGQHPLGEDIPRWDGGNRVGVSISGPVNENENGTAEGNKEPDIGVMLLNQKMAIKLNDERFYDLTQERRTEGADPEAAEKGKWSTNALVVGTIGELDDGLCVDRDRERVSRSTVVSVVGPSGEVYEERAGVHQYQYRKLMMQGAGHDRWATVRQEISSYGGLSGSGVWRQGTIDTEDSRASVLLSGVVIEEETTEDISGKSKPNALVYHAGRSLFGIVKTMFQAGISPDW